MGITEWPERIVVALEKLADATAGNHQLNGKMVAIAEANSAAYRARNGAATPATPATPAAAPAAPATPAAAPAAPATPATPATPAAAPAEWTYDTLKAELLKRGVEVAKGQKMTTLLKLWEECKNQAAAPAAEPATDEDIFGESEPEAPKPPMTLAEAKKILMEKYTSAEGTRIVRSALAKIGVNKFSEVPEGQFEALIAAAEELSK